MGVGEFEGKLRFDPFELDPYAIPGLLVAHATGFPATADREAEGVGLRAMGFPPVASAQFVENVCRWGKGHRIIPKITATPQAIADALREADGAAERGRLSEAVARIAKIPGLGQSFASKQLRFLHPDKAVILDSVIRGRLGYRETSEGYDAFLSDCRTILAHVQALGNVKRPDGKPLRICDIEAAIFKSIRDEAAPLRNRRRPKTEK